METLRRLSSWVGPGRGKGVGHTNAHHWVGRWARALTDRRGIHSSEQESPGAGPMDAMVIGKQHKPNRITAESEFTTKLWNDVRILTSTPQRAFSQFRKCPFSSFNSKEGGRLLHLTVSTLIMCFVPVMPQKHSHCNISSCLGKNFNILPADINRTFLTKSQRCHIWDVI